MNYQHNNNAARLNKRVAFYNPPGTTGEDGWPSTEWVPFKKLWAEIKTQKGYKSFNSDATQWQGKRIVGIRYRNDIHTAMRLEIAGVMYEIESLVNDDERNQWITIIAKEVN
ncbi:phage head closure protein [Lysinibacillus sp. NPDC096418]|uniref:phage head closure protein n=1 Tax=Lysinibacillus sp. NPDC096418 TaxID=3364138 RepID=UPI0038276D86